MIFIDNKNDDMGNYLAKFAFLGDIMDEVFSGKNLEEEEENSCRKENNGCAENTRCGENGGCCETPSRGNPSFKETETILWAKQLLEKAEYENKVLRSQMLSLEKRREQLENQLVSLGEKYAFQREQLETIKTLVDNLAGKTTVGGEKPAAEETGANEEKNTSGEVKPAGGSAGKKGAKTKK